MMAELLLHEAAMRATGVGETFRDLVASSTV